MRHYDAAESVIYHVLIAVFFLKTKTFSDVLLTLCCYVAMAILDGNEKGNTYPKPLGRTRNV